MKEKVVVLSCAPVLNEVQTQGLMQLVHDFEQRQYRVIYYGNHNNKSFNRYRPTDVKYNKLIYKIKFYWVLLRIDRHKWIARLKEHLADQQQPINYKILKGAVRSAVQYFCTTKPDLFICWNPFSPIFGVMADTARLLGIKTGGMDWGFLPGTFLIDSGGTLAHSQVFNGSVTYADPHRYLTIGESLFSDLNKQSVSLYQQATEPLPDELVQADARQIKVLLIGIDMVDSGAVPDTDADRIGLLPFHKSCITQALDVAAADPDFRVILKPHPSHNTTPQSQKLSDNCWLINTNPDELISWADVIICSGSKMEFSALFADMPLVNIGAGILYKKGCSYEINQPAEIADCIRQAWQHGVTHEQLQAFKIFLGYLHEDYLYLYNQSHNNAVVLDRLIS